MVNTNIPKSLPVNHRGKPETPFSTEKSSLMQGGNPDVKVREERSREGIGD
jgi:hypothetical protein